MSTKEYLEQIDRLEKMIKNKLEEIYKLRLLACGTTVLNDADRVQTSTDKDKLGRFVVKIADMEKEVDKMIDKRTLITSQIEKMENIDTYDILARRYILNQSLKSIAVDYKKTIRQIIRQHQSALDEFEYKYGKDYL